MYFIYVYDMHIICFFFSFRGREICHFCELEWKDWDNNPGAGRDEEGAGRSKVDIHPGAEGWEADFPFLMGSRVGLIFSNHDFWPHCGEHFLESEIVLLVWQQNMSFSPACPWLDISLFFKKHFTLVKHLQFTMNIVFKVHWPLRLSQLPSKQNKLSFDNT